MNRFNDKETGRIVFLLDRRACHPSVKLSSVDIVILYDSDLNPYNDLKVLQKISIDSQHEQLKLFRLFSLCTLEEMVLIQAKQGVSIDPQNLNHSTIHQLLRWGAAYSFEQLVEFHDSSSSSNPIFSSEHLVKELFGPLTHDDSSVVVKVNQTGGTYSKDISLPGELEMQSVDKDLPHVFWTKLLNRKTPKWRYFPAASSSHRKRVRFFQGSLEKAEFHSDYVTKKRRKVLSGTTDAGGRKSVVEDNRKVGGANRKGASVVPIGSPRRRKANKISSVPASCMSKSDQLPVQQELEGETRESEQSCQTVLTLPSEPPKASNEIPEWAKVLEPVRKLPTNVGARIRECVHKALDKGPPEWAKKILGHCISKEVYKSNASGPTKKAVVSVLTRVAYEVSHRKPVVVKMKKTHNGSQSGHITPEQAEYPTQLPATDKHAELHSHDVVEPLEPILQLPIMSVDKSLGESGTCVSESRSMGGVPVIINHPWQSAPITSSTTSQSLLHHEPFLNESARIHKDQVGLVINSAPQSTYNDAWEDAMHQQPMIIDRRIAGSVTRVSDFRSLGVVPECVSHPLPIAPMTCSQTPPENDPLLHELARIHQEWEQVVKFHEELKTRIRCDFHREVQEINKKYSKLQHDNDTAFGQTMNTLYKYHNIFLMNEMLAECFRDKTL